MTDRLTANGQTARQPDRRTDNLGQPYCGLLCPALISPAWTSPAAQPDSWWTGDGQPGRPRPAQPAAQTDSLVVRQTADPMKRPRTLDCHEPSQPRQNPGQPVDSPALARQPSRLPDRRPAQRDRPWHEKTIIPNDPIEESQRLDSWLWTDPSRPVVYCSDNDHCVAGPCGLLKWHARRTHYWDPGQWPNGLSNWPAKPDI